jgi:hypothetical protein
VTWPTYSESSLAAPFKLARLENDTWSVSTPSETAYSLTKVSVAFERGGTPVVAYSERGANSIDIVVKRGTPSNCP